MIKNLFHKLLGKPAAEKRRRPSFGKRVEVPASIHHIDPALVDDRAKDVVQTLRRAGFDAYIVGGAVRDLLVGLKPKDFDVATNATPEEVKRLFRRAFIIGRRFRIVHVVYGRGREHEVIEVSTFRAYLDAADAAHVNGNEKTSRRALEGVEHAVDASGRLLRDNVWGPQEEDAARRDFTINAMYYDPESEIVVDYHKGMADVQKRVIRMIGEPALRYHEDPVRIIRAIRFAAKLSPLGFKADKATVAPLRDCLPLLTHVPQSRMFDEMLKLLQTGHAMATVELLARLGFADAIYPLLGLAVDRASDPFVRGALQDTDRRVGEGKPVAPSFLLACLLWQDVREAWQRQVHAHKPAFVALQDAIDEVFEARIGDVSGRGKLAADMREIWMMQPRFDKRTGNGPYSLVAQLRFRAGFDFFRLRASVGEVTDELADWWQTFSTANDAVRDDLLAEAREQQRQQQKQARQATTGKVKPTGKVHRVSGASLSTASEESVEAEASAQGQAETLHGEPDSAPARKRRKRHRKGTAAGIDAPPAADMGAAEPSASSSISTPSTQPGMAVSQEAASASAAGGDDERDLAAAPPKRRRRRKPAASAEGDAPRQAADE